MTAREAYDRTFERRRFLMDQGFNVEKWQCDLTTDLQKDPEMANFFNTCNVQEPLNPRDGELESFLNMSILNLYISAFYGGRTNATKLYHKAKRDAAGNPIERIDYIDVCSLFHTATSELDF